MINKTARRSSSKVQLNRWNWSFDFNQYQMSPKIGLDISRKKIKKLVLYDMRSQFVSPAFGWLWSIRPRVHEPYHSIIICIFSTPFHLILTIF